MKKKNDKINKVNVLLVASLLLPMVSNANRAYAEVSEGNNEVIEESEVIEEEEITEEETKEETEANEEVEENESKEADSLKEESKDSEKQEEAEASIELFARKAPGFTYEFIEELSGDAVELGQKFGVYPSIMIAQAALETGWGGQGGGVADDYVLGLAPNYNLFGIKGKYKGNSVIVSTKEEVENGEMIEIKAEFKKYPSYRESMEDYVNKIRFNQETISWAPYVYEGAWFENSSSYIDALEGMKSWASSSSYRESLKRIIKEYSLEQYDQEAFGQKKTAADKEWEKFQELSDSKKKWEFAQKFKANHPNDLRLQAILNTAGHDLMADISKANDRNENLFPYLDQILKEDLIHSETKKQARMIHEEIKGEEAILSADEYYEEAMNAYGVSDAWEASREMKVFYPNDPRLEKVIKRVAERNFIQGERVHRANDYETALIYYDRVLAEDLVKESLKERALNLRKFAEKKEQLESADHYYDEAMNAYGVSDAWAASKEMKAFYPKDKRLQKVIDRVADRNFIQGERVHRDKDYETAVIYYDRVLAEDSISESLKKRASSLRDLAVNKERLLSADEYYDEAMNAYGVSDAWEASIEMKEHYPNDSRLSKAINKVARRNLTQGKRVHKNGDFETAIIYFDRVLAEEKVNSSLIKQAKAAKKKSEEKHGTADYFYEESMTAPGVSDAWEATQGFKKYYPKDKRLTKAIKRVASRNLSQGKKVHRAKEYDRAIIYYDRILAEKSASKSVRNQAASLKEMASDQKALKSANAYYQDAMNNRELYKAWRSSQSLKKYYPSDRRIAKVMRHLANRNLKEGKRVHGLQDYEKALIYYNRVVSDQYVDASMREATRRLIKQAERNERQVIYVDPGHGGSDTGAVVGGLTEKALNLQVANYVREELEKKGFFTLSSREVDQTIELSNRAKAANKKGADLFVSVHHNSGGGSAAKGIETFIHHRVAGGFGQETNRENFKVDDPRIKESLRLADSVHNDLIKETGMYNRGVKGNNFAVLRETRMPAILVELGFMDNPKELSIIKTRSYQRKAARSIANGVDKYYR